MQEPEPVRRTSEIEDVTNLYFIHPMANRLTLLLRDLHIPPNAVSVAGMLFGLLAGFAYFRYEDPRWASAGFILMIAWHVMDGADGQLARLTHAQSETGRVLDGICDYVTFIAVYTSLALALSRQHGDLVWLLVVMAGACHAVHSAAYEVQRQEYDFWALGRGSKDILGAAAPPPDATSVPPTPRILRLLGRLYAKVQFLLIGSTLDFHERLDERLRSQPERTAAVRRRYRQVFAQPVRRWSVLSANYRTLGIFIFAMLKVPLYYFFFEIFGFSIILAALAYQQRWRHVSFLNDLRAVD